MNGLCFTFCFGFLIASTSSQSYSLESEEDGRGSNLGGCPTGTSCQAVVDCAGRLNMVERKSNMCKLGNLQTGLCCKQLSSSDLKSFEFIQVPERKSQVCPSDVLRNPLLRAASFSARVRIPMAGDTNGNPINTRSSTSIHNSRQAPKPGALHQSEMALDGLRSLRFIPYGKGVCFTQTEDRMSNQQCLEKPTCDPHSKYRSIDGRCNNLMRPNLGRTFTPLQRILHSDYYDGFTSPRRDKQGRPLPSGRLLSTKLMTNKEVDSHEFTNLVMALGQFIDHDFAHVPTHRVEGESIDCCEGPHKDNPMLCFPIAVPAGDRSFSPRKCLNFVRSMSAPDIDCKPGPNQQQNQLTHWLDGSNIYGSTDEEARELRTFERGLLKMVRGSMLPHNEHNAGCINPHDCFLAGDDRVNEQMTLTVVHTVWCRIHNHIASHLYTFHPRYNDEKLYQEARRIIVALLQHIVYNEWLPVLLGPKLMDTFGLWTLRKGFSKDYRKDFNPSITNSFAAAAFRVGHTMIPSFLKAYNIMTAQLTQQFQLRKTFNLPSALKESGVFDQIALGSITQSIEEFDNGFTSEVTDHLFEMSGAATDLIALNVQRGRDHGLPGYIKYREICGFGKVRSFEDLGSNISHEKIRKLRDVYSHVDDIDLFIGLSMENKYTDAYVGQTFLCLIGDQFARLKKGDRFFYDLQYQAGSFTKEQLYAIRKFSLASLFCNTTGIQKIQPFVLAKPNSHFNQLMDCSQIPKLDLSPWKY